MPVKPKAPPPKQPHKKTHNLHLAFKDREYFINDLSLLLKSAVPVGDAIESMVKSARTHQMRHALQQMQADIDAGSSLADALEKSGIAGSQTLALVRLGEASGKLVDNLQLASQEEEKRHIFQARVRSALIYPVFVLGLTLVVGLGVAWFLLPRLSQTFAQLQVKLPPISQFMINIGEFLKEHGAVFVPVCILVILLVGYILFAAPRTKHLGMSLLFKVPGLGGLLREVEVAQFGYLLGTLLNAGLPVRQAVDLLTGATTSRQYAKLYRFLGEALEDGFSFREAFGKYEHSTRLIPASVQQMIFSAERSGSLPDVLQTIGRTYEEKSEITTKNLESVIEPILLVIVAGGVMLVAIAVIVPVYSLVGGLGT